MHRCAVWPLNASAYVFNPQADHQDIPSVLFLVINYRCPRSYCPPTELVLSCSLE